MILPRNKRPSICGKGVEKVAQGRVHPKHAADIRGRQGSLPTDQLGLILAHNINNLLVRRSIGHLCAGRFGCLYQCRYFGQESGPIWRSRTASILRSYLKIQWT